MTAYDAALDAAATASSNGRGEQSGVTLDGTKLLLPPIPERDDVRGLCRWLSVVFNLDPTHPVKGAVRQGVRGSDGHVVILRVDAPEIAFEPASRINTATKLIETLSWWTLPSDGAVHALKSEHCRQIAHVVRMLCGAADAMTRAQEADAIVGTFTSAAVPVEKFTTYGTSAQRYEAAVALRRDADAVTGRAYGPARYLIDRDTGELVVAVSELQDAARRHIGSSLHHGWLDARMEAFGWARIELAGYGPSASANVRGPHARIFAYRGHWLTVEEPPKDAPTDSQGVNT